MPLPAPIYPPYAPRSFVSQEDRGTLNRAVELYAKYHPAAMQQRLYQTYLEDETFQAKQASERMKLLMEERDRLLSNLAKYRSTGLGPSGRAGGSGSGGSLRAGRQGASGGDALDFYAAMGRTGAERDVASQKLGVEQATAVFRMFQPVDGHREFIARMDGAPRATSADALALLMRDMADDRISALLGGVNVGPQQRAAAANAMWTWLSRNHSNFLKDPGARDLLARTVDDVFITDGFIQNALAGGREPSGDLMRIRADTLNAVVKGVGPNFYELMGMTVPLDLDGDGEISASERATAARKAAGLNEPLTPEEQVFLSRYVEAMRDDGVATRDELGADYEQARAAYEKARLVETLPRGMDPFYDEAYLQNLQRLAATDAQLASIEQRPPPAQAAARRTLGLPTVSSEALDAAAMVSPLAAEALPYALRRVQEGAGDVTPRGAPEVFAQQLIDADPNRDFRTIAQAVVKRFPNNPSARREALAYYGAYYYVRDTKASTLNQGAIRANPVEAATERAQFMREVAPPPAPRAAPPVGMADPGIRPADGGPLAPQLSLLNQAYNDPFVQAQIEQSRGLSPGATDLFLQRIGVPSGAPPMPLYPADPLAGGALYQGDPLVQGYRLPPGVRAPLPDVPVGSGMPGDPFLRYMKDRSGDHRFLRTMEDRSGDHRFERTLDDFRGNPFLIQ
jgi:hypothetical protein